MAGKYEKLLSIKDDAYEFIDTGTRVLVFNILRGVVIETPRDKGIASGNWTVTLGNPSDYYSEENTSRSEAIQKGSITIEGFRIDRYNALYVQNHVPYIERLNLGWSKQAGSFYVDKIVKRAVNG